MPEVRELSDRPTERGALHRSAAHLRGHRVLLVLATLVSLGAAAARVSGFALAGVVTDAVLAGDRSRVTAAAAGLGAVVPASFVLTWLGGSLVVRLGEGVVRDLREHALARVAAAPLRFVEAHRGGELVRRLTGEIADLSSFVGGTLPALVNGALLVVVTGVVLAGYSWPLTLLLVALATAASWGLVRGYLRRAPEAYAAVAVAEAQVSARFSETLPAAEQLRLLDARERRLATFAVDNRQLLDARTGEVRTALWLLALDPVGGLAVVVLLGLSAAGAAAGWLTAGGAVVFLLAARSAFADVEDLVGRLGELRAARTHLARVLDLVVATDTDTEPLSAAGRPPAGELRAEGVGLRYGERAALDRVDLRVAPGERLVVVGETGSGKTTLGKVLTGLYRPDTGRVLVGGVPLAALPPDVLRATAVLVPQEVLLVSGTVADNLAMVPVDLGPDPRARMVAAADSLELAGWLRALPDGLDTEVGDHGSLVSAGERQLLALVRAALVDPLVLVLDEATAAVDPVTAARVEEALARASRNRVVVVIAHRPDTVDRAERRVELVSGRVRG